MRKYALITLNIIEYTGIYLKKQSSECDKILNVFDALHSIMSLSVIERETYSEHCQTFKMKRFAKIKMNECRFTTRKVSGQ